MIVNNVELFMGSEKKKADKSALIVIDVVNSCCHSDCERKDYGITFSKIRDMIPRLNDFIEEFRNKKTGKIIFVNLTPWTKDYLPQNIQNLYEDPSKEYYNEGSEFELDFYEIKPNKSDLIVTKNNYDAFSNPELDRYLKSKGINNLVITGVFTDGCVLATVCGAFRLGYNITLITDLVGTTDNKTRQALSENLIEFTFPIMYGKTVDSKDYLDQILKG